MMTCCPVGSLTSIVDMAVRRFEECTFQRFISRAMSIKLFHSTNIHLGLMLRVMFGDKPGKNLPEILFSQSLKPCQKLGRLGNTIASSLERHHISLSPPTSQHISNPLLDAFSLSPMTIKMFELEEDPISQCVSQTPPTAARREMGINQSFQAPR